MFDIGFSELMVIGIVALLVIGPERLPKVARTFGHLMGRLQRYVNDVKADIDREMEIDELRKVQSTFQEAAREVEQSVHAVEHSVQQTVTQTEQELSAVESAALAPPASDAAKPQTSETAAPSAEAKAPAATDAKTT